MSQDIRDIYCTSKINFTASTTEKGDLSSLYDTIKDKLDFRMNSSSTDVIYNSDMKENFISLRFSQKKNNPLPNEVKLFPPKGPILRYTTCLFCKSTGPSYHNYDCPGPFDENVITKQFLDDSEFKKKLKKQFWRKMGKKN